MNKSYKKLFSALCAILMVAAMIPMPRRAIADDGSSVDASEGQSTQQADETQDAVGTVADDAVVTEDDAADQQVTGMEGATGDAADQQTADAGSAPESDPLEEAADRHVLAGADRYETAALEAKRGWPEGSPWAIVASGEQWSDVLSASGLAGLLDCPVLITPPSGLGQYTADALKELGVQNVVLLGSESAVGPQVEVDLAALGVGHVDRISGADRFETQLAVYEYGKKVGAWNSDYLFVAQGASATGWGSALSLSAAAFRLKAPVFTSDSEGMFTDAQMLALVQGAQSGFFHHIVIVGDDTVSSYSGGVLDAVTALSNGAVSEPVLIGGATPIATNAAFAAWAVSNGVLDVRQVAFSSGISPWDALGAGAMQGKLGSALLFVDEGNPAAAADFVNAQGGCDSYVVCGGDASITPSARERLESMLTVTPNEDEAQIASDAAVVTDKQAGSNQADSSGLEMGTDEGESK